MVTSKVILLLYLYIFSIATPASSQTVVTPSPLPLPPSNPDCFSLKESKFCGGSFGEYYMSNRTLVNGVLTADVVSFDRAMGFYFGSPQDVKDINTRFGCLGGSGWDGIYEPPYRASFTCRSLLKEPAAMACNKDNPVPDLCQKTCQRYIHGWETIIRNETACPATPQEEDRKIADTLAWCDVAPFNGVKGNCIDGKEDQQRTCGFILPMQFPYLCSFCQFSDDPCCRSESAKSCGIPPPSKSIAVLVCSIVFGCLGGIGLIIGIIFYYKRKKLDQIHHKNSELEKRNTSCSTARLNSSVSSIGEYVCEFLYKPALPDELAIEVGDSILVLWMFDDGWAVGRNLTRGGEGAFPLACVVRKIVDSAQSSKSSIFGNSYPHRGSSKRSSHHS
ncbi:hypothetical protein K493DRAFT_31727 [Basidiobolus meristosporus CBS 931.73]|uniref:SH3 domain-containing protein n=1 Tax=Basidiobolus meristosporus CBS 931.73 TaxID=1314790 RepID=A0A1Y1Z6K3_9FUNG|nr:hypothetical protein K493DRAFT_31727 [Basidiobolus meristosporus CBS 931.73]|eukprot:ORY05881.1 hypothetical protein K493DRAFT_31727 [Basidiobolus meristosporus CBS 931.73]